MKCITLFQPHATLMVIGEKKIETRPRKWSFVGPVAIHAGLNRCWMSLCDKEPFKSALKRHGLKKSDLAFGAILGQVQKLDCVNTEDIRNKISQKEMTFGNYENGRYAYLTNSPKHYDFYTSIDGHQGIWEWSEK